MSVADHRVRVAGRAPRRGEFTAVACGAGDMLTVRRARDVRPLPTYWGGVVYTLRLRPHATDEGVWWLDSVTRIEAGGAGWLTRADVARAHPSAVLDGSDAPAQRPVARAVWDYYGGDALWPPAGVPLGRHLALLYCGLEHTGLVGTAAEVVEALMHAPDRPAHRSGWRRLFQLCAPHFDDGEGLAELATRAPVRGTVLDGRCALATPVDDKLSGTHPVAADARAVFAALALGAVLVYDGRRARDAAVARWDAEGHAGRPPARTVFGTAADESRWHEAFGRPRGEPVAGTLVVVGAESVDEHRFIEAVRDSGARLVFLIGSTRLPPLAGVRGWLLADAGDRWGREPVGAPGWPRGGAWAPPADVTLRADDTLVAATRFDAYAARRLAQPVGWRAYRVRDRRTLVQAADGDVPVVVPGRVPPPSERLRGRVVVWVSENTRAPLFEWLETHVAAGAELLFVADEEDEVAVARLRCAQPPREATLLNVRLD